jgi:hypothetical protein
VIADHKTKLQIAQFKLCYRRAFMLRAYPMQTHEMLFDAHNHALNALGGVPERGIYDNMKTAVDKVGRGKQRAVNSRFQAMVNHFLFEAEFCKPAAGWVKGRIEKNVQDARHRLWHQVPPQDSLEALNDWLAKRCRELWDETPHPEYHDRSIAALWAEECAHLMPIPASFDCFVEQTKSISSTYLMTFEGNSYRVPAAFANRPVSLRVYAQRLVVVDEAQIIAEHPRFFNRDHKGPGKTIYDWRHYLAVVQRKPGALRNGAPFTELPLSFKRLQSMLLKRPGGDREMVDILALLLHHDEQKDEQAVGLPYAVVRSQSNM